MQIYGTSQIHGAQSVSGPHPSRAIHTDPVQAPASGDHVDISEAGRIASQMAEIPDIRAERVQQIRAAILNGSYETDAKLSTALDRLLDEIA